MHETDIFGLSDEPYLSVSGYLPELGNIRTKLALINIINQNPEGSILDVVYNLEMIDEIKKLVSESEVKVIYVNVPRQERITRIMDRMKESSIVVAEQELDFRDNFLRQAGAL